MPKATVKRIAGWPMVWAILLIAVGLLAIALPLATSLRVILLIGWLLIFSGVTQALHAFQSKGIGNILWKLLIPVLYFGLGIYLLTHPVLGIAGLTLAIGLFFFAQGALDLVAYFSNRKSSGSSWTLVEGIIALILGLMIWRHWPSSSSWIIGTLVGISMLVTGLAHLMITLLESRPSPQTRPAHR